MSEEKTNRQNTEVETITIGETAYIADSLTEHATNILNDIKKVETRISQISLDLNIMSIAKGRLIEELDKESANFIKVDKEGGEIV